MSFGNNFAFPKDSSMPQNTPQGQQRQDNYQPILHCSQHTVMLPPHCHHCQLQDVSGEGWVGRTFGYGQYQGELGGVAGTVEGCAKGCPDHDLLYSEFLIPVLWICNCWSTLIYGMESCWDDDVDVECNVDVDCECAIISSTISASIHKWFK